MAKESPQRRQIKSLSESGENILFPESEYLKIARMLQDLNRLARIERLIEKDQVFYSIQREGAPKGQFFVVRNY